MNDGQVNYAERKAMELFDQWNDVTGCYPPGTSYYAETEACIIDAVHIGIQIALHGKVKIEDGNVIRGDFKMPEEQKIAYQEPPTPPAKRIINEDLWLKKIICKLLGYKWLLGESNNVASSWTCSRCGEYHKAVEWPKPGQFILRPKVKIIRR